MLIIAGEAEGTRYRQHAPGCNTHKCDVWANKKWRTLHPLPKMQFTGYVVEGKVSWFGGQTTADGGTASRPCIALREHHSMGHMFLVEVDGHKAKLLHCDYGPAEETGREIDITAAGTYALHLGTSNFPTDHFGVARELR